MAQPSALNGTNSLRGLLPTMNGASAYPSPDSLVHPSSAAGGGPVSRLSNARVARERQRSESPTPSANRRAVAAQGDNNNRIIVVGPDSDEEYGPGHDANSALVPHPSKKPALVRSQSEYANGVRPPNNATKPANPDDVYEWGARHGFEDHYQSEDVISQLADNWYMYFADDRHETTGKLKRPSLEIQDWRMRDRLKTVSAALVLCLNIGVEPPDQLRTSPGAKLEAWTDPTVPKALETIGKSLQAQYETLAIRTRYKQYLDPSNEEMRKFAASLRRNAKDERILFHYNGHGVPKPTASGEIWVFNRGFTQYIPISLYDLQQWLQAPTVFVWDCSEAGNILTNYHRLVEKHEQEEEEASANSRPDAAFEKTLFRPYIHLAACNVKENLPTNPLLPADLFTACLTTPIEMALWFFVMQNPLKCKVRPEEAKKLPGRLQERRTPLGELNWIFTAITDTIAWTTLPRNLFRKFFRQDLMVAALFRNFLLAQRIMPVYNCHPQSYPELPDTHSHPLWNSWDLAVDMALSQMSMLERKEVDGIEYEYVNSTFFTEQLTAFEIYLSRGDAMSQKPPDQLPVVLQVLLSQQHRLRALILLTKFLDLGPWAVQLALSIGIFPYVLKLLQSAAPELRPPMVFIWARILAVDISCQQDLIKDSGYIYFTAIANPDAPFPNVNVAEHKAMCAFILAMLCKGYKQGQIVCNSTDILLYCLELINNQDVPLLRQWCCLCISQLWQQVADAKWRGVRENAHHKLALLTRDKCPEVRAAMAFAMTTFLGIPELTDEVARIEEGIAWTMLELANDGSPLVRKELLVFLSHFVKRYEPKFMVAAYEQFLEEKDYLQSPPPEDGQDHKMGLHYVRPANRERDGSIKPIAYGIAHDSVFAACWKHIGIMSVDPHPEVQRDATIIFDHVHHALLHSTVGAQAQNLMDDISRRSRKVSRGDTSQRLSVAGTHTAGAAQPAPSPNLLKRTASYLLGPLLGDAAAKPLTPPLSPKMQRTASQRSRKGPSQDTAPPEQYDQKTSPANYHVANEPLCAGYQERSLAQAPTMPLSSMFLDWSIEYFRRPQMRNPEEDEPGSFEYNERLWRRSRNEAILRETQPQKTHAGTHRWSTALGTINNGAQPAKMAFHQFENHLAVADDGNTIHIWDWKLASTAMSAGGVGGASSMVPSLYSGIAARKNRFSNGNPERSKISDMKFINEDDQALLMTGSSDGVLRVYRGYDSDDKVELASSWRALTHMVPSNVNSGMVFEWQQVNGQVLVAGDERVIRIWNAGQETCTHEIPARSGSCVTSLTSDQMTGNIFVAGFGDGAVRVFDTRMRPHETMVRKWKDDGERQWVRSVHMQRGGQRELLSASRNGTVRLWDIRVDQPLRTMRTTKDVLRTASTHEHLPVFAVGTSAHLVKIFNFDGHELNRLEPYSSFLQGHKGTPISTTTFHPHHAVLACAARGDNHINLFACGKDRAGAV